METVTKRQFLTGACLAGAGFLLSASSKKDHEEVTAVEDLMREHGVLRRILFVYSEAAARLRGTAATVSPAALQKAAHLFRSFGEEYHEKKLEEAYIFPALMKAGPEIATDIGTLIMQHQRGREITDYILAVTSRTTAAGDVKALAPALEALVRMYRPHAAREDTVVFPAWKKALSERQLDELGDKFEDIERQQFGADGFENAVKQIKDIEAVLGLTDLAQFTAINPSRP